MSEATAVTQADLDAMRAESAAQLAEFGSSLTAQIAAMIAAPAPEPVPTQVPKALHAAPGRKDAAAKARAQVAKNAPPMRTQSARAERAQVESKADVKRDLSEYVLVGGKVRKHAAGADLPAGTAARVSAVGGSGTLFTRGARFALYGADGRPLHRAMLPIEVLEVLCDSDVRDALVSMIATVNEGAGVGQVADAE